MTFNFVYLLDLQLLALKRELQRARRAAYAEGTQRNHRTQWRAFLMFCNYFNLCQVPASVDVLCLFCQFLSRSMTPESVRNYLSGVKLLHIILGENVSHFQSYEVKITLKGIQRLVKHVPSRAPPITPDLMLAMARTCNFTSDNDIVILCAFSFTFFLFARVSNIVPLTVRAFNPQTHLCRGDIVLTKSGLLVTFRSTKTIQLGKRVLSLPLLAIPGSPICPVYLFRRMLSRVPASESSPAFSLLDRSGKLYPLTKSLFVRELRDRLQAAGVTSAFSFRGHSFRRGATTWAFQMGIPGEFIQIYGDWASDAYKMYLEFSMPCKLFVADKMRERFSSSFLQ